MTEQRRGDPRRRARNRLARLLVAAQVTLGLPLLAIAAAGPAAAAEPLPLPTYDAAAVANPTATASAGGVPLGGTPGGFSVDDAGTARYEIPLRVVPGRGGLQPHLSLSYRADGGNGQVGAGFALTGLSQISRCDRTPADDGIAEGVALRSGDRLCLNGLKLVAVSGTYGTDGAEYRTAPDTHVRVRSHRPATAGSVSYPTHFTVWTADGQIQHYGGGGAEAVQVNTWPGASGYVTWPLTRVEDRAGNVITYEYAKRTVPGPNELERWLTAIRYGHGAKLDRLVTFGWETRPDKRFGHAYGAKRESTQRLKSITMSIDAGGLKRARGYTLAYETAPTTGASRLVSVLECGSVPTECRRPTTVEWWNGAAGFRPGVTQTGLGGQSLVPPAADVRVIAADYNGDGRTDLAWPQGQHPPATETREWKYLHAEPGGSYRQVRPGEYNGYLRAATAYPIDYDLDGRVDLLPREAQITSYRPILSRPNFVYKRADTPFYGGFNQVTSANQLAGALVGDLDGDGYQDVLEYTRVFEGTDIRWSWRKRSGTVSPSIDGAEPTDDQAFGPQETITQLANLEPDDVQLLDANGDGRDEIVYNRNASVGAYDVLGKLPTFDYGRLFHPVVTLDLKLADLNGDGLTDLITNGATSRVDELYYWINDGRRFADPVRAQIGQPAAALPLSEVVDYDGDGRHELLVPRSGGSGQYVGLDVVRAQFDSAVPTFSRTATQVTFTYPLSLAAMSAQGIRMVDADGDGQQDVLLVDRLNPTSTGSLRLFLHAGGGDGARPDLLRRVREGAAHPAEGTTLPPTVEVEYGPLSDADVHAGGDCPRQPQVACTSGGMHVVKRVTADAGLAGDTRMVSSYFYQRARVAKQAQTFLGFAERRVTTISTAAGAKPVTTRTFYSNAVAGKDPRPLQRWTYTALPNGKQSLERTNLAYATKTTVAGSYFDHVSQHNERSYQIPANCCLASLTPGQLDALGHLPHRTVTDRTESVDQYGNLLVTSRLAQGNGVTSTRVTTTVDVDEANWLVRRPTKVVTRDGPGDHGTEEWNPEIRTTGRTFLQGSDLVSVERQYHTDADRGRELITAYQYDAEGNVVRTTATDVASGQARETTAVFDPYGYPHATMNAVGHVSRTGYDPVAGTLKVTVDANGLRTDRTYDSLGRPVRSRGPSGAEATVSYTAEARGNEQLLRVERADGTGAVTQTVADRLGRPVIQRTKGLDGVLRVRELDYAPEGRLVGSTVPRRAGTPVTERVTYTYDDTGRMLTRTEPGNAIRSWSWSGLEVTETDARGNKVRTTLDALGRQTAVVDGLGSPREVRRTFGYGPYDTLLRTAVDGVATSTSTYTYDERNNVLTSTEPGQGTSTATYDAFGGLLTSRDALNREATLSYDALGRLTERTVRRGGALHSLQRNHWDVNATKTRARKGLLLEAVRTDQTTGGGQTGVAYEYDNLSRLSRTLHTLPSERDPAQAETFAVGTEHDAFGRVTAVRYPTLPGTATGTKVGYDYSPANGQLTAARVVEPVAEAGALWTARATDGQDRLVREESGDGVTTERQLDWRGAVLSWELRTASADTGGQRSLLQHTHQYDKVGNLVNTRRTHPLEGWADETFGYDELDRVTEARVSHVDPCPVNECRVVGGAGTRTPTWTGPAAATTAPGDPPPVPTIMYQTDSWAYDKLGNVATSMRRGTHTYDPAAPYRLTSVTGGIFGNRSYGYDAVGNQTARPGATLTYTDRNLPARILTATGTPVAAFAYWPDGQRARRTAGDSVVTTVADLYERRRDGDRVEHRLLVRAAGRVVATLGYTGGAGAPVPRPRQHVHADRLGSTLLVTADADAGTPVRAEVREERSYDAYGLPRDPDLRIGNAGYTTGIDQTTVDQGYTGHEEDRELGLVDMGGRVYDPTQARFLTADPFVSGSNASQAWNRYSYVSGNPLRHTDPSGFEECFGCPERDIWGGNGTPIGKEALDDFFRDSEAFAEDGEWGISPVNERSPSANRLERYGDRHSAQVKERMKELAKSQELAKQRAVEHAKRAEAARKLKLWLEKMSDPNKMSGQDAVAGQPLAANDVCQPGECDSDVAADVGPSYGQFLGPVNGVVGGAVPAGPPGELPVVRSESTMGADGRIWPTEQSAIHGDLATRLFEDLEGIRKSPLSGVYATVGVLLDWSDEQIHDAVRAGAEIWKNVKAIDSSSAGRRRGEQVEPTFPETMNP